VGDRAPAPREANGGALAAGFRILLEKPIDPQTLISAVATLAVEARDKPPTQLLIERAAHVD
jgi:CheY-like chemotaxis protein